MAIQPEQKAIFIVDAYGPARLFREYVKSKGLACIHIQSTPKPLPRLQLTDIDKYDRSIVHDGDLGSTANQIRETCKNLNVLPHEIIAGVEPGVLLADQLSSHFALRTNGTAKSAARRDKFAMANVLERAGIAVSRYIKSAALDDLLGFFETEQGLPIVLKPLDSAGTNGVHICLTSRDVEHAYKAIIGVENNMGSMNREVLAQGYLKGLEYFVNTVSHGGTHYVTDIWLAEKVPLPGHANIYDKNFLIDSHSREFTQLSNYVFRVLDALDIKYGAGHTEVIITENGPMIVECASRISGALDAKFNQACLGHDQIQVTLESYIDPESFMRRVGRPYPYKKAGLQMYLSAKRDGIVMESDLENILNHHDAVISYNLKFKIGDAIRQTIDLSSAIGVAHIVGATPRDLLDTYKLIKSSVDQILIT